MSKKRMYGSINNPDKKVNESSLPKNGSTTEITIAGKKFKVIGPRDSIEMQRIIKSQSIMINNLQNENITIRRTVGRLQTEMQELKNLLGKLNSRYFGDEV